LNYHEIASTEIAAENGNKLPILTHQKLQTPILNETSPLTMKHQNSDLAKKLPPDKKMNTQ